MEHCFCNRQVGLFAFSRHVPLTYGAVSSSDETRPGSSITVGARLARAWSKAETCVQEADLLYGEIGVGGWGGGGGGKGVEKEG